MPKALELSGQRFGRWTVLRRADAPKNGCVMWVCICDCGTQREVTGKYLKNGRSRSCGCLEKDVFKVMITKHGLSKENRAEYATWIRMKERCFNKNNHRFKEYGARGITVCDRWKESFENFLQDMGKKPSSKHSIDRKNNDGNYEPSNCKWSIQTEQTRNQRIRRDNTTNIPGVTWHKRLNKYRVRISVENKRISLGCADTLEEAKEMRLAAESKYWGKQTLD
ncbi:hypothetical protein SD70_02450 [Gordoniibacillus kamchatkensis]|uniref:AP2 domain-containing protein n=1 Tax=Gordoniibacillus kamchatkensis TaxID=1590651 RepID=A0ABR5AM25_9BACL|nr:AP2 domain-containing protein [Paenibacillus sp. VKM B-2647]KIL42064.1 hypothetical protein SD70_02450 [Paenibacillus sp. VKM B-2647]